MPPIGAFTGFTTTGENTINVTEFNVSGAWADGWHFYCNTNGTGETIYFPASGCRSTSSGAVYNFGSRGFCYSASPTHVTTDVLSLYFQQLFVDPQSWDYRGASSSVRPVKE